MLPKILPSSSNNKKTVSVLGSTGTIGKNTVDVIKENREFYDVIALTANNNVDLLVQQAKLLRPKYVVIANEDLSFKLEKELEHYDIKTLSGKQALLEVSNIKCDVYICAIVGISAFEPLMKAIKARSNIGIANKECLVAAGDIIKREVKANNVSIIPIDSEHNAIFQTLDLDNKDNISDIILTASGGPFRDLAVEEMKNMRPEQAIKHPNFIMGKKISVDSATMMNKGLEMIEAYHLFNLKQNQIQAIIHREQIIHGIVNYKDGTALAMMNIPDMRVPISYTLNYPKRIPISHTKLSLTEIGRLSFEEIDHKKFPAVNICMEALKEGGNMPCVLSVANEVAVQNFLEGNIGFLEIISIVYDVMNKITECDLNTIGDVLNCDSETRKITYEIIKKYKK
ncbi:1-deoxy-D-xylulose-5-phosphate reductoisomerase [Pseudomonadota bacterium]